MYVCNVMVWYGMVWMYVCMYVINVCNAMKCIGMVWYVCIYACMYCIVLYCNVMYCNVM